MAMVEAGTTKAKITNFIVEKFPGARKRQLNDDTALLEAGIVDSIGVLEIVAFIEQTFAITVSDEDLLPENFGSIACIAQFVEGKLEPAELREAAEGTVCDPR
jgi:acyl carrier protein